MTNDAAACGRYYPIPFRCITLQPSQFALEVPISGELSSNQSKCRPGESRPLTSFYEFRTKSA